MDDPARKDASLSGVDSDGVRVTQRGGRAARSALFYKVLAFIMIGCLAAYSVTMAVRRLPASSQGTPPDVGSPDAAIGKGDDVAATGETSVPSQPPSPRPIAPRFDPNDLANFAVPGQPAPQMKEVISELHKAGIHTGLGAFSPPGTSPPLVGLAVPDSYVLPKGYVRHTQATDDGQRIDPILMYSPDFEFFDSAGNRITIPVNRVVPADLAPPGLPIKLIEIPPPLDPGSRPV